MEGVVMKYGVFILSCLLLAIAGCGPSADEKNAAAFVRDTTRRLEPLMKEASLAYWQATTGDTSQYKRYSELDLAIRTVYSDTAGFARLSAWKTSGAMRDPILAQQVELLRNSFLINQVRPDLLKAIVELAAGTEAKFSSFRGRIDGREATANDIESILTGSADSKRREKAWLASKQVGPVVAADAIRLVKLRNEAARALGFENYHTLALKAAEQDVAEVTAIFDKLDSLTLEPYRALKTEIDSILAVRAGVPAGGLKPWHYHDPFFQETPQVYSLDLDRYYSSSDVVKLASSFFSGLGLPVDSILSKSDLFERENKNPHAFSTDIDRLGDVRILCNVKNNEQWMGTMLHELGHATYSFYTDRTLPFLLRDAAHAFTTEGVANFFGRLSRDAGWMQAMLSLSDEDATAIRTVSAKYARAQQLIFARWSLVMFGFEKGLYADPDQDLNALWWSLVEKYQLVGKPEGRNAPDWAAKIHFVMAPCYYHNYLLGELFASQVRAALVKNNPAERGFVDSKTAGDFFRVRVFEPGARYPWNEMIRRATGETLNPRYFVEQFVK
jgi:peptidyl-dipeptidase A